MQKVKISPKFQVVIPKELRERLELRAGQSLAIYEVDGQLRLETLRPLKTLRGIAPGVRWQETDRDRAERL